MKPFRLAGLLCALAMVVVLAGVAAPGGALAQAAWALVSDPAERFAVEMPGPARRLTQPNGAGGAEPAVSWELEQDDAYYVAVSTQVPGQLTPEEVDEGLDASAEGAGASTGGKLVWKRTTTVSGMNAREAEYSVGAKGMDMRARVLITYREGRLYQVLAVEDAASGPETADRMMRSFRLLN